MLLDPLEPLSEKVEGIGVSHIIDQHYHVGFPEEFKGDLLEDVLPSDVDEVKLYALVRLPFNGYLLDVILAALGHHVVVVEGLLANLVDEASLADCGLTRYDHSRTQYRHILILF